MQITIPSTLYSSIFIVCIALQFLLKLLKSFAFTCYLVYHPEKAHIKDVSEFVEKYLYS